jgi:hypothetical protein
MDRINRGTTSMPPPMTNARKASSFPVVAARLTAERPMPADMGVRTARRKIAIRSSTMRTPKTMSFTFPRTFPSANALMMIVVLEMAISAPPYRLSSAVQPNSCPLT